MATHHASPGEIVDLRTWAEDLPKEASKVIFKIDELELARLVFATGDSFPDNDLPGPVVIHCLSGNLEIEGEGTSRTLSAEQLLYLSSIEPHSIKAISDSVVVMTVALDNRNH